jgi:hypothetical protein
MAIEDDVLIDYVNKRIYGETTFLAGSTFYTVNELYTHIMDTFDGASQMDDSVPFGSGSNVLTYIVANGWYIEQALIEHLKGASIETSGYNDAIRILTLNSGHTIVAADIGETVTGGTTGDTGILLDVLGNNLWVRMDDSGDLFDDDDETIICNSHSGTVGGSVSLTGEELFSNVFSIGTVNNGYAYISQNGSILTSWWGEGNSGLQIDVLVKVRIAGTLIDSGTVTVYNRNYGDTYANASADLSGGGRVPVSIETQEDPSITLTSAQIDDYIASAHGGTASTSEIAVAFGTYVADIDDSGVDEDYVCRIDEDSQAQSVVYQALQWMTSKDRTAQILDGVPAPLYRASDAGYTPIKTAPFASMAGTTLIFAQGNYPINVGTGSYISTDTIGVQHTPPSTMSVALTGLVSGDRCVVFRALNGEVIKNMFTSHATNNDNTDETFEVQESIPKDTPQSGYIRIVDTSASTEQRYAYISWTGSVFTLSDALSQDYDDTDTAYVGYIDESASTTSISKSGLQYVSDRTVIVRVRNSSTGGNQIIPFEVQATIQSTGLSVPASRNPDNVIGN